MRPGLRVLQLGRLACLNVKAAPKGLFRSTLLRPIARLTNAGIRCVCKDACSITLSY
jgi:hypothetical protein